MCPKPPPVKGPRRRIRLPFPCLSMPIWPGPPGRGAAAISISRGGAAMIQAGRREESRAPMSRRDFLAATGLAGAGMAMGGGLPRAEAQPGADISGELVACVAGGAWETAFREHMAKPFGQKYPKVK